MSNSTERVTHTCSLKRRRARRAAARAVTPPMDRSARVRPGHSGGRADAMPSAVGYGGYAPRNPSGHLSRLLAGIPRRPVAAKLA